jgi:hypothetical protein
MLLFVYLIMFLAACAALTRWRVANYHRLHEGLAPAKVGRSRSRR